jgi:anti-anti-sigma factor
MSPGVMQTPWSRVTVTVDEVDRTTLDQFRAQLVGATDQYGAGLRDHDDLRPRPLVVDLGRVTFMDTGGAMALLAADDAARAAGGRLHLVAPGRIVVRLLQVTGVADLIGRPSAAALS